MPASITSPWSVRISGSRRRASSRPRAAAATFVRQAPPTAATGDGRWQHAVLPPIERSYLSQVVSDTWRLAGEHDHINLALGWASADLLPVSELAQLSTEVFATAGAEALSYGDPDGLWELREQLAQRGSAAGFARDADEIVVTNGGRQAIHLVARAVISPGDVVVTESPTYMGTLVSMEQSGARVLGVPYDSDGLDVDALEQILARHEVKLVSVQTGSQNPTGQDMSPERVQRLLALARERSFFVMEDGVYSTIRFGSKEPPRMRLLAPDHVIYVDSLSKTIGGGLRVGWIAAAGEVRRRLTEFKLATDYHTPDAHAAPGRTLAVERRSRPSPGEDQHGLHAARSSRCSSRSSSAWGMSSTSPAEGRAPLLGYLPAAARRTCADERGLASGRLVHARRRHDCRGRRTDQACACPSPCSTSSEIDEGVRRMAAAVRAVRRSTGSGSRIASGLS